MGKFQAHPTVCKQKQLGGYCKNSTSLKEDQKTKERYE